MLFVVSLATTIFNSANAQYANDVVRFSSTTFGGTARIQAMGGAQTALGGDISSVSGNPAGLGFYRKSDISVSPQLSFATTNTGFLGFKSSNSKENFNISNLGLVLGRSLSGSDGSERPDGWSSIAFGLSLNRTNNFHNTISYSGNNNSNSLGDFFASELNFFGIDSTQPVSYAETAYNAFLVDQFTDGTYFSLINGNKLQTNIQKTRGSQSDFSLALGSNLRNKLYLGGSINFSSINSRTQIDYTESGYVDTIRDSKSFIYQETTDIDGSGINAKIGFIYRPVDMIRFGGTIQTPTFYQVNDAFQSFILTSFNTPGTESGEYSSASEYNLVIPFRYSFGLALFFQKYGFITADYEGVDYGSGKYRSRNDAQESFENALISNSFTNASNLRFGGELKLSPMTIRGGYAIYGDPFTNNIGRNRELKSITGGLGYANENFYIDAALINSSVNSFSSPYSLENGKEPVANTVNKRSSFMVTIGTRF